MNMYMQVLRDRGCCSRWIFFTYRAHDMFLTREYFKCIAVWSCLQTKMFVKSRDNSCHLRVRTRLRFLFISIQRDDAKTERIKFGLWFTRLTNYLIAIRSSQNPHTFNYILLDDRIILRTTKYISDENICACSHIAAYLRRYNKFV